MTDPTPAVQTPALFDLDEATQQTTAELQLKHPVSGAALSAVFVLAGPEHPARKDRLFAIMRRRRAQLEKEGRVTLQDPTDDEQDETDMLVASTLGWSGMARAGQPLEFTAAAARALYADPKWVWIREQVKKALDQRELFIVGSANA